MEIKGSFFWFNLLETVDPLIEYEYPLEVAYCMNTKVITIVCENKTYLRVMDINTHTNLLRLWTSFSEARRVLCNFTRNNESLCIFLVDGTFIRFTGNTGSGMKLYASPEPEQVGTWVMEFFKDSPNKELIGIGVINMISDVIMQAS